MPYKHVDPVPIHVMLKQRYQGHHSICETLREIYMATEDEGIKMKCRVAVAMAKKMHEKLKEYKQTTETMEKPDASTQF
jgi:hypothetical protein